MDPKQIFQNKWLVLLGILGIGLIVFGTFWNRTTPAIATLGSRASMTNNGSATAQTASTAASSTTTSSQIQQLQASYDQQLTNIIKQLDGVYDAVVMVTLDSTSQLQVANNVKTTTQTQRSSGQTTSNSNTTDTQVFTERQSDGSNVPFVVSQQSPKVRGVVVLVHAKDFYVAKSEILNAIGHVLDVPAYKISVEPKRSNP